MSQFIEKEIKTALTLNQYHTLRQHFNLSEKDCIIQENYYFDTIDNQLKQLGIGLRLRLSEQSCEFTLKKRLSEYDTLEITDTLTLSTARQHLLTQTFPIGQVADYLQTLHISLTALQQIGYLKNERLECENDAGLWVLDKSHFKTGVSYELEFEYTTDTAAFFELLSQFHISYITLPTKLARALQ